VGWTRDDDTSAATVLRVPLSTTTLWRHTRIGVRCDRLPVRDGAKSAATATLCDDPATIR